MIDHISICVRDLEQAARFYEAVLEPIGYTLLKECKSGLHRGKNGNGNVPTPS